jgi:hypothetical protein
MNEEKRNPEHASGEGGYERQDLSPKGVFYFMAGLAVLGVVIHLIISSMYGYLDRYDKAHQPPVNPLVTTSPNTRQLTRADTLAFPQPRLEENEIRQLNQVLQAQNETLATYGWVDEKAGVVRIPIDRAMEIVAQNGLPVLSPGVAQAAAKADNNNATMPGAKPAAPQTK